MNALPILLLSVGSAIGAGVVTSIAMSPSKSVDAGSSEDGLELVALRQEVNRLNEELATMRREAEANSSLAAAPASTRLPIGDIEQAVRRYLDEHLAEHAGGAGVELALKDPAQGKPRTAQEFLEQLLADDLDWDDQEAIWARIREAGQIDEVIALFEARAEENPNDPNSQVDLGHAYLQKIYELGDSPAAGLVATKADTAYARALELDDRHWEARFSKAVALSFWPPIFGKQQEAITQFETLLGQQEEGAVEDRFGQSYLLLGNLYHQVGQPEKAAATWARGFVLFPDSAELQEKNSGEGGDG